MLYSLLILKMYMARCMKNNENRCNQDSLRYTLHDRLLKKIANCNNHVKRNIYHGKGLQGFHCFTFSLKGPGTLSDHKLKSGIGPVSARKFSPFLFGILFQHTWYQSNQTFSFLQSNLTKKINSSAHAERY